MPFLFLVKQGELALLFGSIWCVAWESKWQRTMLSPQQQAAANRILTDILRLQLLVDYRKQMLSAKEDTTHHNVYKTLDWNIKDDNLARRYRPLCKFGTGKAEYNAADKEWDNLKSPAFCSCAFIEPTMVVLAGHCFTNLGISPETYNIGFVVPQYGRDDAKFTEHLTANARIITEWWYPDKLAAMGPGDHPDNVPWDVAFLKIDKPIASLKDFYTLSLPWSKTPKEYSLEGKKLIALGYPADYKGGQVAVDFKGMGDCNVATAGGMRILAIDGKEKRQGNAKPANGKTVEKKDKPVVKKSMTCGGSGGPWILNEDELPGHPELAMAVFSVISKGAGPCVGKVNYGPMFTPGLLQAAAMISARMKKQETRGATEPATKPVTFTLQSTDNASAKFVADGPQNK